MVTRLFLLHIFRFIPFFCILALPFKIKKMYKMSLKKISRKIRRQIHAKGGLQHIIQNLERIFNKHWRSGIGKRIITYRYPKQIFKRHICSLLDNDLSFDQQILYDSILKIRKKCNLDGLYRPFAPEANVKINCFFGNNEEKNILHYFFIFAQHWAN